MELIIINKISKGCSFFASFKTAQSGVIKRFTKRVKWNIRFSYFPFSGKVRVSFIIVACMFGNGKQP